jgi:hypothetical protein
VVVPWPGAAENHQVDNARTLSDNGAAVLLEQRDLSADSLAEIVGDLIEHPGRLAAISAAAYAAGERHRDASLIELIDAVAAGEVTGSWPSSIRACRRPPRRSTSVRRSGCTSSASAAPA